MRKFRRESEQKNTSVLPQLSVKAGGISIEGARALWVTPLATPMILRSDRALKVLS